MRNGPNLVKLVEAEQRNSRCSLAQARLTIATRLAQVFTEAHQNGGRPYNDFSVRECWEAFVGPTSLLEGGSASLIEAPMMSSGFTLLTGNVIQQAVLDSYNATQGLIADQLVTKMPSKLKVETLTGTQAMPRPVIVDEGQEIPTTTTSEKGVQSTPARKRGLAIEFSREMILFDQTGLALQQAQDIGPSLAYEREENCLKVVTDHAGYQRYKPKGFSDFAQENLYRSSSANDTTTWHKRHVTSIVNPLVDWTSLHNALVNGFASRTDEEGRVITVPVDVILVPFALTLVAAEALGVTGVRRDTTPSATPPTGVTSAVRTQYSNNPLAQLFGGSLPTPLMSNILDTLASDATGTNLPGSATNTNTWYMGAPKRQFVEQEHWGVEVELRDPNRNRQIVAGFQATRLSEFFAKTDAYMLRCLGA